MRPLAAVVVVALLVAVSPASATTVLALDEATLVANTDLAIAGVIVDIRTSVVAIGPGVFTDYIVAVDSVLVGAAPDLVVVRVPGGQTGERDVRVEGMPSFTRDERVVLFLESLPAFPDGVVAFLPVGLNQGVWRVAEGGWVPSPQPGLIGQVAPAVPRTIESLRTLLGARSAEGSP